MSATDPQGLQAFPAELRDRAAWLEPFDWYQTMRETEPVRYDPDRQVWDVFRYDDVKRVLDEDGERFSVDPRTSETYRQPERPEEELIFETMLFQDPPRHDVLRGVVEDSFDPRALRDLEPEIRNIASGMLDEAVSEARGTIDFVEEIAYPLPVVVIAEMLGIPSEERDRFKRWSDTLVEATSDDELSDEYLERQRQAQFEMATYFLQALEARQETPRDDLLTDLALAVDDDSVVFTQEEALGTCILLLIAGNVTTTNLLANAIRCFAPQNMFDGGSDLSLPLAIEEVARYRSPVQAAITRVALEEVTLGGKTIEAGDQVIVWLGSANRDGRQFEEPDRFVPDRRPNQHLAFGHGTHYCLGAPLARLEARVAFEELFDRVERLELAEADLQPTRSSFVYGVESLPVRYERNTA